MKRLFMLSVFALVTWIPAASARPVDGSICGYGEPPVVTLYRPSAMQTVEGQVSQVRLQGSRAFILMRTQDEAGVSHRWMLQWTSSCALNNEGITRFTVKPGDRIHVTGNVARNGELPMLFVQRIARPADGWTWASPAPHEAFGL